MGRFESGKRPGTWIPADFLPPGKPGASTFDYTVPAPWRLPSEFLTDGDKLRLRFKDPNHRNTDSGGLSEPPAGVHLYATGNDTTLCGFGRSEAPSINAALREGKDVCPDCARSQGGA